MYEAEHTNTPNLSESHTSDPEVYFKSCDTQTSDQKNMHSTRPKKTFASGDLHSLSLKWSLKSLENCGGALRLWVTCSVVELVSRIHCVSMWCKDRIP